MKTIIVPTFTNDLEFKAYKKIKIKNKPSQKCYDKVSKLLPGICQGYCINFFKIFELKRLINVVEFYDIRQRGIKKLKKYCIIVYK